VAKKKNYLEPAVLAFNHLVFLQNGRGDRTEDAWLSLWKNVAHYISNAVKEADMPEIVADPYDITMMGSVLTGIFAEEAILGHDSESIGLLVPSVKAEKEKRRLNQVLETRLPVQYGELLIHFAGLTKDMIRPKTMELLFQVTPTGHHQPVSLLGEARIRSEDTQRRFMEARREAFNTTAKINVFIQHYKQVLAEAKRVILDFNMNRWSIWTYSGTGTYRKFNNDSLKSLEDSYRLPSGNRFRVMAAAGNVPDVQAVTKTQFRDVASMFYLYNDYVINTAPLSTFEREAMIEALHLLTSKLRDYNLFIQSVDATIITVDVDESGNIVSGQINSKSLPVTIDKFLDYVVITIEQLTAPTAIGLMLMQSDREVERAVLKDYFNQQMGDREVPFINPFKLNLTYSFPLFTGAAHKAESNKRYRFLILACSECEPGECFEKALIYCDPKPTDQELNMFRIARLTGREPMDQHLIPVHSIGCMIVRTPRKNGSWSVIASNRPALKTADPQSIDLTQNCVMCMVGDHMYRVTRVTESKGAQALSERIFRSGMYTLHRPDSMEAYRHLAVLSDPMQQARFSREALAPLAKTENFNEVLHTMAKAQYKRDVQQEFIKRGANMMDLPEEEYGIKNILIVDAKSDEFTVLRSTCPPPKIEDLLPNLANYVVAAEVMGGYCSVIEYHVWTKQEDLDVYASARDQYQVLRGKTWADTVKLMPLGDADKELLATPEDLTKLADPWFVLKEVRHSSDGDEYKFWKSSTAITEEMIASSMILRLWRDEDGTFFVINNELPYVTPCPKMENLEPIVIAFDAETGNKDMYMKKAHTTPIIFHACRTEGPTEERTRAHFEGKKCSFGLVDWLVDTMKATHVDRPIVGFGFNNCNFDNYGFLPAMAMNKRMRFGFGTKQSKMVLAGHKLLEIQHQNLTIHDIRRFCNGSLDFVSRSLKCKATKTGWNHEHCQEIFHECGCKAEVFLEKLKVTPAIELMKPADQERLRVELEGKTAYDAYNDYCANDCEVTLQVAYKLREAYLKITHGKMDIFKFMTLPQAMYTYITDYQKENGITLYKCKTSQEYAFAQSSILAGTSRVFKTAPRGMTHIRLGDDDETSEYPHKMHQAPFALNCDPMRVKAADAPECLAPYAFEKRILTKETFAVEVTDIVPGCFGIYRVRVTKQPVIEVMPFKGKENGLGCHMWDYKGEFEASCTNIHVINHRYFGGECKILYGYVYPTYARGAMTQPIEDFKAAKQEQDYIKGLDPETAKGLGLEFNPVVREAGKGGPNASSGKMVQKPNLDKLTVIAAHEKRQEFMQRLSDKHTGKNIREVSLTFKEPGDIAEQLDKHDIATAVMYEKSLESLFEKGGEPKSIITGIYIYAWSHHHFLHALIGRCARAKACWIQETDTLHYDVDKYEAWMWENMPQYNPYDVPAPTKEQLPDPIFDMPIDPNQPLLNGRRLGYFLAADQAIDWYKRFPERWLAHHKEPYEPERKNADFGDFKAENGFKAKTGYEAIDVCYIGKKCYYIYPDEAGKEKMRFKGVGNSTREATELVQYICKYDEAQKLLTKDERGDDIASLPEYQALLKRTLDGPCILKRALYQRLADGYGVDACERRFVGGLAFTEDDGCSLHCDLVIKRLAPPGYFHLMIRTDSNSEAEKQHETMDPKEGDNITAMYDGQKVPRNILLLILLQLKILEKNLYARRGTTLDVMGKRYYVRAKTMSFLLRKQNSQAIVEHYQ
jgi:hypothetical protein